MPTNDSRHEQFGLIWEKWHPVVAAISGAVITGVFFNITALKGFRDLLQAAVNLSAITVGFLATSKSILFAIGQNDVVRTMKKDGKWPMLIDYMMAAIYSAFLLAIMSGLLLLIDFQSTKDWHQMIASIWTFFLVLAFVSSFRVIRFFARILKL